jgi:hypothetical protein
MRGVIYEMLDQPSGAKSSVPFGLIAEFLASGEYSSSGRLIFRGSNFLGWPERMHAVTYILAVVQMATKSTKRFPSARRSGAIVCGFYALYLGKTALGIDFFPHFSAWRVFKLPIAPILEARYGKNWH